MAYTETGEELGVECSNSTTACSSRPPDRWWIQPLPLAKLIIVLKILLKRSLAKLSTGCPNTHWEVMGLPIPPHLLNNALRVENSNATMSATGSLECWVLLETRCQSARL
jgi:hypothetical protein